MSNSILIIDDSQLMQRTLRRLFKSAGMWVQIATDGLTALQMFRSQTPEIVLLDLNLPSMPGRELCRTFKREAPSVPVVVLSASDEVGDKVLLLELGADDYVTKPFSPQELLARVRRCLRRSVPLVKSIPKSVNPLEHDILKFGDVTVDFTSREAFRNGKPVALTKLEFKLLKFLANSPEIEISRETFLTEVWNVQDYPTTRTIDTHILYLRQKLEPDPTNPRYFVTVYGVGYRFTPRQQSDSGQ